MRYALINKETKLVENVIMWDGDETNWKCPETHMCVESLDAGINDEYDEQENDFRRKLSNLKPKTTEQDRQEMESYFQAKKAEMKSGLLFENPTGELEV